MNTIINAIESVLLKWSVLFHNTEDPALLKVEKIKGGLKISWKKNCDYHSSITFKWREILVHMKIDVTMTHRSTTNTIELHVNGKEYYFGVGRSTVGAGMIGKKPQIETGIHNLTIQHGWSYVLLTDTVKEGFQQKKSNRNPFKVISIPAAWNFAKPLSKKEKKQLYKEKINTNEVRLNEFKNDRIDRNSLAYFDGERLIVDYWLLGSNYEDELFIIVTGNNLDRLYQELEVEEGKKAELLIAIHNTFRGNDAFREFEKFLNLCDITYQMLRG